MSIVRVVRTASAVAAVCVCMGSVQGQIRDARADLARSGFAMVDAVPVAATIGEAWVRPEIHSTAVLNMPAVEMALGAAAPEGQGLPAEITLPMPEGHGERFAVWQTDVMAPELAAKFPEITTYAGVGLDDPSARVRITLTPAGLDGQILAEGRSVYIDRYTREHSDVVVSYHKYDLQPRPENQVVCLFEGQPGHDHDHDHDHGHAHDAAGEHEITHEDEPTSGGAEQAEPLNEMIAADVQFGGVRRTYRLAVTCTGEYASFHGGTVSSVMSAIVTTINRVTGIYERDLSVRMQLVPNNDDLIYLNAGSDPFSNNSPFSLLNQSQNTIDSTIGNSNYDIGHVVSTGGGGVALLGAVCRTGSKGQGVTGLPAPIGDPFDVDYVSHEMGHQFGGNHTFNGISSSCGGGNRNGFTAYEPGSGTTIMAYAGICGGDNVANSSQDNFHIISLDEISDYITGTGNCAPLTNTGNQQPTIVAPPNRAIPANTPFVLTAEASDPDGGSLTYSWEEFDLGPGQTLSAGDNGSSPLFRTFSPTTSPTRYFPSLGLVVNNQSSINEKLPTVSRSMTFRAVVRDNFPGGGAYAHDSVTLSVIASAGPFEVLSPNGGETVGGIASLTWDVAGTDGSPINASTVDVLLSTNNGSSFDTVLASDIPNTGAAAVVLPLDLNTSQARLMVRGGDNYFYDISDAPFTIEPAPFAFGIASALPTELEDGEPASFTVAAFAGEGESIESVVLHYSVNGGPFATQNLSSLGDGIYEATIPAQACGAEVDFFVTASSTGAPDARIPESGEFSASVGLPVRFSDNAEDDLGWTTSGDATDGNWNRGIPLGNNRADPAADADGSGQAWLTNNDPNDENSDVDNGTAILTSPIIEVEEGDIVSYAYWFNDLDSSPVNGDRMQVLASVNGSSFSVIAEYTTAANIWRFDEFEAGPSGDFDAGELRLRFTVNDLGVQNVIEGGVDAITVMATECPDIPEPVCKGDANGDQTVTIADVLFIIARFGDTESPADVNQDEAVTIADVLFTIARFGKDCFE